MTKGNPPGLTFDDIKKALESFGEPDWESRPILLCERDYQRAQRMFDPKLSARYREPEVEIEPASQDR